MKFPTYKEMGEKVAEEALDGYEYKGKTLREWIDALSQEPCDAISRQAVLDTIADFRIRNMFSCADDALQENIATIECLPSVTPKQKSGKWITEEIGEGRKVYCSECKESAVFEYVRDGDIYSSYGHGVVKKTKFCPNCGAKMENTVE